MLKRFLKYNLYSWEKGKTLLFCIPTILVAMVNRYWTYGCGVQGEVWAGDGKLDAVSI